MSKSRIVNATTRTRVNRLGAVEIIGHGGYFCATKRIDSNGTALRMDQCPHDWRCVAGRREACLICGATCTREGMRIVEYSAYPVSEVMCIEAALDEEMGT